jgi:limonene 1,2-monooxygenase
VFIAAAAERTRHIRLGTGVVSLPYHHPLMVADRWVLLDHLTRGRVMFGAGPGALPSDAYMMGVDPVEQRRMMQQSLEAIMALFRAAPTRVSGSVTSEPDPRLLAPIART